MDVRILGCGASMGVPVVGCQCQTCRSPDPRNHRLRTSALVRGDSTLLIDCGPDFREQALHAKLAEADGVLITHAHMDHIGGIDDLRGLTYPRAHPLPILCHQETATEILSRHHYMFEPRAGKLLPRCPMLEIHAVEGEEGEVLFQGSSIRWIRYDQVGCTVLGYRIGSFAYLTDIKQMPAGIESFLRGVSLVVLSALQHEPHEYFLSLGEAVEFAQRLRIPRTILTHLSHEIDAVALADQLPRGVQLGCDGAVYSVDLID